MDMDSEIKMASSWAKTNPFGHALSLFSIRKNFERCIHQKEEIEYTNMDDLVNIVKKYQGWVIGRPVSKEVIKEFVKVWGKTISAIFNIGSNLIQTTGFIYHLGVIYKDNIIEFGTDDLEKDHAKVRLIPITEFVSYDTGTTKKFLFFQKPENLKKDNKYEVSNIESIYNRCEEYLKNENIKYDALNNNCDHVSQALSLGESKSIQSEIIHKIILGEDIENMVDYYQKTYYTILILPKKNTKK